MSTKKIWSKVIHSRTLLIALSSFIIVAAIAIAFGAMVTAAEKEVTLTVNGNQETVRTYAKNVSDLLEEQNIVLDKVADVNVAMGSPVEDGQELTVKIVADYKVMVDGEIRNVQVAAKDVAEVVEQAGVSLNQDDIVEPSLASPASDGLVINVCRVEIKEEIRETELAYSVETKKDSTIVSGDKIVVQAGQTGLRSDTYRVEYRDGVAYDEELVDTAITDPVTEIVAIGTGRSVLPDPDEKAEKGTPKDKTAKSDTDNVETDTDAADRTKANSENEVSASSDQIAPNGMTCAQVITMKATAYHEPPGSLTKSGTLSRVGAVAVDPRVIPLGTKLYVEGYGYCVAEDTGGLIKGNRIDIYLDSEAECNDWGVRNVTVYILK